LATLLQKKKVWFSKIFFNDAMPSWPTSWHITKTFQSHLVFVEEVFHGLLGVNEMIFKAITWPMEKTHQVV
jgi:hypothetical protein